MIHKDVKYRLNKKQKAAKHFGVPETDLTEIRQWIPKDRLESARKYLRRIT